MSKFTENETGNSNKDEMLAKKWEQVSASQVMKTG